MPMLKEITLNNEIIAAAWISSLDKEIAIYSEDPKNIFDDMSKKHFEGLFQIISEIFDTNSPEAYWTNIYKSVGGNLVITVILPYTDSNGKIIGVSGMDLSYDRMLKKLNNNNNAEGFYKDNDALRLFITDKGNLISLTNQDYSLLSVQHPKEIALGLNKTTFLNVSLLNSSDNTVRKMTEDIINNNSGEFRVKLKGNEYLLSHVTIPVNNWNMAVLIKTDILNKTLNETRNQMANVFFDNVKHFIYNTVIILTICLALSYYCFRKQIVKPIETLRNQANMLGDGDFRNRVQEKGFKEIYDLSKTFNNLGSQLESYTARLEKEIIIRESIESQIKLAKNIQNDILPVLGDEFNNDKFSLFAKLVPAKEVSGDFYDAFFLKNGTLVFIVADVSGKGFPAAFFMAIARTTVKNLCHSDNIEPHEVLERANNLLTAENQSSMFATAFLAFYDIKTGTIKFSNAGHLPAILLNNKTLKQFGVFNEPPLGFFDGVDYTQSTINLNIGDSIILHTDGITEAIDENKVEYDEKLIELLKTNSEIESSRLAELAVNDVIEYQKDILFDDITICILTRKS